MTSFNGKSLIRGAAKLVLGLALASLCGISTAQSKEHPNIVVILADDMGYGDIQAYNSNSQIPTPNLNQMAARGMRFTDAHTSSAVCTPSRYSILTGRYAWRSSLKKGVTFGYAPLIIDTNLSTLPSMLKKNGYQTAAIGKWHLGLGSNKAENKQLIAKAMNQASSEVGRLSPGPNEVGFDYFYGISASLDMPPYIYIENGRPHSPLSGKKIQESVHKRKGGEGYWRKGDIGDDFKHEDVLPHITDRALSYIAQQKKSDKPFFLYFSLTAPHTPWLATETFRGASKAGHYGDFAVQVDHVVGQVNSKLENMGLLDSTIVIYTSDNGAHWYQSDIENFTHRANAGWRGQKADIHEAGHRVPFIVQWPEAIEKNSVSNKQVVLTDLYATVADIIGQRLGNSDREMNGADSISFKSALFGQSTLLDRQAPLIHHSLDGMFAIRVGDWKLVEGLGSGGFTQPKRISDKGFQLYNLKTDPQESINLAEKYPERVAELLNLLNEARNRAHTRS